MYRVATHRIEIKGHVFLRGDRIDLQQMGSLASTFLSLGLVEAVGQSAQITTPRSALTWKVVDTTEKISTFS